MIFQERDKQILRWINGFGFATANQIQDYMKVQQTTAYVRIKKLVDNGYLARDRILHGDSRIHMVTKQGCIASGDYIKPINKVNLGTYLHDLNLVDLALRLERKTGGVFQPERQIRHDEGLLAVNFGVEDASVRDDFNAYEENGITAQKVLDLIEGAISFCIKEERAAHILKIRLGVSDISGVMTLQEIGEQFGVSRERIRQIEKKAFASLVYHIKRPSTSYVQELQKLCQALFLNCEEDPLEAIILFCKRFYVGSVDQIKISMILGMSLHLFSRQKTAEGKPMRVFRLPENLFYASLLS